MKKNTELRKCGETLPLPGPSAPGGVYLCQVNERVSCGACCGLYNVPDLSRSALESMLIDRTQRFDRVPREANTIVAFGRQMLQDQCGSVPFPEFHHCPFVGLVGQQLTRVGCLLHPLAAGNDGVDYRGLSYYGGMACRVYFCPTHHKLSRSIKTIVRETADNWYEYGLIVTEARLLEAFFLGLEHRLGAPVTAGDILQWGSSRRLLRKFSQLKIDWPYRRHADPGPCNYVFDDHIYDKTDTTYPPDTAKPSPHDVIFRELESGFCSDKDLRRAEGIIGGVIDNLVLQIQSVKIRDITG